MKKIMEALKQICDTDPHNGGPIAYGPKDITVAVATEWVETGEYANGEEIPEEVLELLREFEVDFFEILDLNII